MGASASGAWSKPTAMRGTMYGPAINGTVRATDDEAAMLRALRAPAMPRPVVAAPPVLRWSRLAIAGAALAVTLPPAGLVVSSIALAELLRGRVRARGENLALAGVVAAVLAITAWIAVLV